MLKRDYVPRIQVDGLFGRLAGSSRFIYPHPGGRAF